MLNRDKFEEKLAKYQQAKKEADRLLPEVHYDYSLFSRRTRDSWLDAHAAEQSARLQLEADPYYQDLQKNVRDYRAEQAAENNERVTAFLAEQQIKQQLAEEIHAKKLIADLKQEVKKQIAHTKQEQAYLQREQEAQDETASENLLYHKPRR